MDTRKITVTGVLSLGSLKADDGQIYVLRGVPDSGEDLPTYAATAAHVESRLLHTVLHVDEGTVAELPDLPGQLVDAYDAAGKNIMPRLAAEVAGLLAGHPLN
jgi:hypothetical protein